MVTTGHELDGWMIQLGRQFDAPAKRLTTQYRRDARKRAVIGIAVASLAVTTGAIAATTDVFDGVATARHERTRSDLIDPAIATPLTESGLPGFDAPLVDQTRLLRTLPTGEKIFLTRSKGGSGCMTLEFNLDGKLAGGPRSGTTCAVDLGPDHPASVARTSIEPDTLFWGVATDDVVAIGYRADGQERRAAVVQNAFAIVAPGEQTIDQLVAITRDGRRLAIDSGLEVLR